MKKPFQRVIPNLRQKAEDLLRSKSLAKTAAHLSEAEALKLIHELEVYEIELEMQNEEFMIAKEMYSKTLKMTQEHDLQQIEMQMQNQALITARLEALSTSNKFAQLFDTASIGFFTISKEGEILELNQYGANLLGKDAQKLINSRFGFFVSSETRSIFNSFLEDVFTNTVKLSCEIVLEKKQEVLFCQLTAITTPDNNECLLNVIDISQLKKVEKAFNENNLKHELAIEEIKNSSHQQNVQAEKIIQLEREKLNEMAQTLHIVNKNLDILKEKISKTAEAVDKGQVLSEIDQLVGFVATTMKRFEI